MGWALALRCVWWLADWAGDLALGAFLALQIFGQPKPEPVPTQTQTTTPQPPRPPIAKPSPGGRRLVIRADSDNQCYVEARANGSNFKFLIDTGASSIAFGTPQHVRQLGLEPALLQYDRSVSTASGITKAADIRLKEFRIGEFVLRDVAAHVVQGLDEPLLGAPVLKLLHLEFSDGACILTLPRNAAAKVAGKRASALLEYDDGLAGFGKLY